MCVMLYTMCDVSQTNNNIGSVVNGYLGDTLICHTAVQEQTAITATIHVWYNGQKVDPTYLYRRM